MSTMEKLLQENWKPRTFRRGEVVEGTVVKISPQGLLLDIGAKSEGLVSKNELERENLANLSLGDKVLAAVVRSQNKNGLTVLSLEKARGEREWRGLKKRFEEDEVIEVKVKDSNRGGLVVSLPGTSQVQGFLPLSHLDVDHLKGKEGREDIISSLKGEKLKIKILELEREDRHLVVSEKEVVGKKRKKKQEKLWKKLKKGAQVSGIVSGVTSFGLFLRLEGTNVEGLVHASEISWSHVPTKDYHLGEEVKAEVLGVNKSQEKIALSFKALAPNPWEGVEKRYKIGDKVKGRVTEMAPFGAFLEVEEGVEGLAHVSEMDKSLKKGEEVEAVIVKLDPARQRMGLSVKQLGG